MELFERSLIESPGGDLEARFDELGLLEEMTDDHRTLACVVSPRDLQYAHTVASFLRGVMAEKFFGFLRDCGTKTLGVGMERDPGLVGRIHAILGHALAVLGTGSGNFEDIASSRGAFRFAREEIDSKGQLPDKAFLDLQRGNAEYFAAASSRVQYPDRSSEAREKEAGMALKYFTDAAKLAGESGDEKTFQFATLGIARAAALKGDPHALFVAYDILRGSFFEHKDLMVHDALAMLPKPESHVSREFLETGFVPETGLIARDELRVLHEGVNLKRSIVPPFRQPSPTVSRQALRDLAELRSTTRRLVGSMEVGPMQPKVL